MRVYNTMTRQKEELIPIEEGKIRLYACGPTVYNFIHIGNARPLIVFDCLRRYFEWRGYEVNFVQNFTDIDDKMIRRANEENTTVAAIAEKYIAEYFVDAKALGIRPATVHPRATEHMEQIIAMIPLLIHYDFLGIPMHLLGTVVLYIALVLTIFSGCNYFYQFYREWRASFRRSLPFSQVRSSGTSYVQWASFL